MEKARIRFTKQSVEMFLAKYWLLLFTVLVGIAFASIEPRFAQMGNLRDIFSNMVVYGIASLGVMLVMITGEIDYACGAELSLGACLIGRLLDSSTFNSYPLAFLITIAIMAAIGALNGFLHVKVGIPGFIATLGTSLLITGFAKLLTNSNRIFSTKWPSNFTFLGQGTVLGVPMNVICFVVIAVLALLYTEYSKHGKRLHAVGSNNFACKYVGISSGKEKMKSFILCSVLCGFAGIIQGSMLNSATPFMGDLTLLNALTMLMLGATFYKIGTFNVFGTIVGAVLVNMINNGMVMVGASTWQKYAVQGLIMIVAVTAVTVIRARAAKRN